MSDLWRLHHAVHGVRADSRCGENGLGDKSHAHRRFESLRTITLWKQNLDRAYGDREPPGQLSYLRGLINETLKSPIAWCRSFPLIDIVAEKT